MNANGVKDSRCLMWDSQVLEESYFDRILQCEELCFLAVLLGVITPPTSFLHPLSPPSTPQDLMCRGWP